MDRGVHGSSGADESLVPEMVRELRSTERRRERAPLSAI